MDRLRREGNWEDACETRELIRISARRNGYSKEAAKDYAWEQIAETFPPQSALEIAIIPVFQWLAKGKRPQESFVAIDQRNGSGDVSLADTWRCGCLAIAMLHARALGFNLLKFKVFEAMVQIAADDPENMEQQSALAKVMDQPLEFLKRFAVTRFESLLCQEDLLPEEARREVRGITEAIRQMMSENIEDVLTATLA